LQIQSLPSIKFLSPASNLLFIFLFYKFKIYPSNSIVRQSGVARLPIAAYFASFASLSVSPNLVY